MKTVSPSHAPDDIDLGFVAHVAPDVEVIAVGVEQIVIGGDGGLVVLNPTASLVMSFLDGVTSLGELIDDFTDALGLDRDVVESDVLSFVRELGASGLLEGVALPEPELPEGGLVQQPRRAHRTDRGDLLGTQDAHHEQLPASDCLVRTGAGADSRSAGSIASGAARTAAASAVESPASRWRR